MPIIIRRKSVEVNSNNSIELSVGNIRGIPWLDCALRDAVKFQVFSY